MKSISKGKVELWAKEGDFEVIATKQNKWRGEQEGIKEGTYQPLDERDSFQKSPKVLTISFFFDGTLNNKYNTEAREKNIEAYRNHSNKKDDSYTNDYSNVAKGFDVALDSINEIKVYIEGIGTTPYQKDNSFGAALGALREGIKGKVKKSLSLLNTELKKKQIKEYDDIHINVFGFSRGAAAARHFLSVTNQKIVCGKIEENLYIYPPTKGEFNYDSKSLSITLEHGILDYILLQNHIKYKKIKFSFAGLYDTVSSFWFPHFDDVYQLDLKAVKYANISIQIQAADEYRYNFDLTNIKSAGIQGNEWLLPGVHSDIGGSYPAILEEKLVLHIGSKTSCEKFKDILIEEGWFKDEQLKIRKTEIKEIDELLKELEKYKTSGISYALIVAALEKIKNSVGNIYSLLGNRKVKNDYDRIPLRWMFVQSDRYLKYDKTIEGKYSNFKDEFIKSVYNQLLEYLNNRAKYRNHFVELYNSTNDTKTKNDIEKEYMSFKDVFKYGDKELYLNYKDYIDKESLKKLRNEYFHWSAKYEIAHIPRVLSATEEENRKRKIQDG